MGGYNKHVRSLPGVAHNVLVGQIGDSIAETDQVFSAHADLSDPGILSQLPADVLDARQAQRGSPRVKVGRRIKETHRNQIA